jgi:hypothetical protein
MKFKTRKKGSLALKIVYVHHRFCSNRKTVVNIVLRARLQNATQERYSKSTQTQTIMYMKKKQKSQRRAEGSVPSSETSDARYAKQTEKENITASCDATETQGMQCGNKQPGDKPSTTATVAAEAANSACVWCAKLVFVSA